MRDLSGEPRRLRRSVGTCRLSMDEATLQRLKAGEIPGDPLPAARMAAIQAAKSASQLIPQLASAPVEFAAAEFTYGEGWIEIGVEVKAIHRTGVEIEAMTAASIAALALYERLSPFTRELELSGVRLKPGRGGYSQLPAGLRAGILVLSDGVSAGERADGSGAIIRERLEGLGVHIERFAIQPDELEAAHDTLRLWCDELALDLAMVTGGTGLGPRDIAPEAMDRLIERRLAGVEEAMHAHGQERTPFAMLSRGRAGQRGRTVLLALPGSPRGVAESLDALLPALLHAAPMMAGGGHGA